MQVRGSSASGSCGRAQTPGSNGRPRPPAPAHAQADIPAVTCLLILDADGNRICCKYYSPDFASLSEQLAFEKKIFDKTSRTNARTEGARRAPHPSGARSAPPAPRRSRVPHPLRRPPRRAAEIVLFDSLVAVYKNSADAWFFAVSRQNENELILANVLCALCDALTISLRQIDKRTMLDNYESVLLTVDELVDGGMILETDASAIANRVGMKAANSEPVAAVETSSFSFAFSSAKETFARSLLR